jgi:hypothetical protein
MYTHWLNGNLVMEPENQEERQALGVLWRSAKRGPPPDQCSPESGASVASTLEDASDVVVRDEQLSP